MSEPYQRSTRPRKSDLSESQVATLRRLAGQGFTVAQMAQRFGLSKRQMETVLARHGIALKGQPS